MSANGDSIARLNQSIIELHIEALELAADAELKRLSSRFQAKARLMVIVDRDRKAAREHRV